MVLLNSGATIASFVENALQTYRENGCVDFGAELLSGRRFGPRFAIVDVGWSIANAADRIVMALIYNIVEAEDRWKVGVNTRHDL